MRYSSRLIAGAIAIVLLTVIILVAAASRRLGSDLQATFAEELEVEVRLVASALSDRPADLNARAHLYGRLTGRRITLMSEAGDVLGDSDFSDQSLSLLQNHADRPEFIAALAGHVGVANRLSVSTNRTELKVAVAAWPGIVRISAPIDQVDDIVVSATWAMILAGGIAASIGIILAVFGGRAIGRPIAQLAGAAAAVGSEAAPSFPQTSVPEIRNLVRAFRAMEGDLRERMGQIRREREETSALIESMAEGVIATDAAGGVVLCNGSMRRMLGFGADDAIPGINELFHRRDAREMVDEVRTGRSVASREVEIDQRTLLMTGQPLATGGAVFSMLDVSDIRRAQLVRRDFVANVSHELKTPLTSILGYTETILTDAPDQETQSSFLKVVHNNARRMQRLVDDLLDLARFESGAWEPTPESVDVSALAREAWSSLARKADDGGIEFADNVEPGFTFVTDRDALQHILTNLLDNAVRHTRSGGKVSVATQRDAEDVFVFVRDTGVGMASEHLDRVFERFYRADPGRSRKEGGTGLGLAIVKHLTEAQGGTVRLESRVGRGTAAILKFPGSVPPPGR